MFAKQPKHGCTRALLETVGVVKRCDDALELAEAEVLATQ